MDRLTLALVAAAVASMALGAANAEAAFGVASLAVLAMLVTGGFGGWSAPARVLVSAAGLFLLFSSIVLSMFALDAPRSEVELWWGVPRARRHGSVSCR